MQLDTSKQFEFSGKAKTYSLIAIVIGVVCIAAGFIFGDPHRTWANLLVCAYYMTCLSFAGMMFLAIQYVANAGWATSILRIPSAFTTVIPFAGVILFAVIFGGLSTHNLYEHWNAPGLTDPNSPNYDPLIAGKSAWLNVPFFVTRNALYVIVWGLFAYMLRKLTLKEDLEGGMESYNKSIKFSAIFCVIFGFTFPLFAFDTMMSVEAHWFSTMFGWWNLAALWVTGLSAIALTAILLKESGHLPWFNTSQLHDLGKLMFGFTIFWTYTWVGQFLLIWYANIPEELTYFVNRWEPEYKFLFWLDIVICFLVPFLLLMTSDNKRNFKRMKLAAIIILVGHWLDYYVMVMPGTVHEHPGFSYYEFGTLIGFAGLFAFLMLKGLSRAPLAPKNHPYYEESNHHHIPNI
ncbi:quinol:cytochrome C oxidoreductase [Solitalea sp. MAHUQ-68]|uniref:Quinol:cytochrome C oxidoreductase n=1 Tax=Solitalea agri TaxID=2953739 RepID=A0A9X2F3A3_9SPHI|nr:quinol:cytochrome C oxidoreductase [Solitalea agri]MCO4293451.1 quinol:cytochrome C oxidoreductase [Solitalea agri]